MILSLDLIRYYSSKINAMLQTCFSAHVMALLTLIEVFWGLAGMSAGVGAAFLLS